jgi:hypothetical protein|tara:strand:+ start:2339 stop:2950 length:612 start_codon:yes stop_codon:yes gene_type:complete
MIKLKELIELQSMVYTETIKPKHKQRFTRPTPSFHENIIMPRYQPPANDSSTTLDEVKYLGSLKPNEELVLKYEEVKDVYKPYAEELGIGEYVDKVIHESVKWIMTLKYDYNRPRPFQIAEFYGINLNGTQTDSMKTPSYPSGHAIQGYLIADILSKHNPSNTTLYKELGEEIAHSRIVGKAHYPSDKKYGKKIADALFKGLK